MVQTNLCKVNWAVTLVFLPHNQKVWLQTETTHQRNLRNPGQLKAQIFSAPTHRQKQVWSPKWSTAPIQVLRRSMLQSLQLWHLHGTHTLTTQTFLGKILSALSQSPHRLFSLVLKPRKSLLQSKSKVSPNEHEELLPPRQCGIPFTKLPYRWNVLVERLRLTRWHSPQLGKAHVPTLGWG